MPELAEMVSLQSPWLCELMAFHINSQETKANTRNAPALFNGCSLIFKDEKPSLSCELFDSVKLELDLTCSICLVSFFIISYKRASYFINTSNYLMLFLIDIWFLLIILVKKLNLKSYQYCKIHHIRLATLFIMLSFLLAALLQQDTAFDPVSLTCGHIFCYMRACKAGSVTIVDGLKAASPKEKCPLCREVNT